MKVRGVHEAGGSKGKKTAVKKRERWEDTEIHEEEEKETYGEEIRRKSNRANDLGRG